MRQLKDYKRTRIMTASPGELVVMLYDGVLQRVRLAEQALRKGEPAAAGENLGRAHDILTELSRSLDADKAPELTEKLEGLYQYCSQRLIVAIADREPAACEEVYNLLKPLRDAWATANEQLKAPATAVNE